MNDNYKKRISSELNNCLTDTSFLKGKKKTGKVRDQYDIENKIILITTDRQSAFDRVLASIPFKGQVLNQTSAWWFKKTEHIIPVDLPKKKYKALMDITLKAHNLMGCRGVTRSDFKYFKGKFYLLEINTQPGMTKLSLVPEIAAFHGISFIKLIELILKDASTNK